MQNLHLNENNINALREVALSLVAGSKTEQATEPKTEKGRRCKALIKAHFNDSHWKGLAHIVGAIIDEDPADLNNSSGKGWKKGQAIVVLQQHTECAPEGTIGFAYRDYNGSADSIVAIYNDRIVSTDDTPMPHYNGGSHSRWATVEEINSTIDAMLKLESTKTGGFGF